MKARAETDRITRSRTAVAALACLLAFSFLSATHRAHPANHPHRSAVVLTATVADSLPGAPRLDHHTLGAPAPTSTVARPSRPATADSSTDANSHTADSPPARGPPRQALA